MDERRTTGPMARALAWLLSCTTAMVGVPGCGSVDDTQPSASERDDSDEPEDVTVPAHGDAPPQRDPRHRDRIALAGTQPPPPLPDPALFGAPDPSQWQLDTIAHAVPASRAAELDPRVGTIEIELEVRPSVLPDRWVDFALSLTASREQGGDAIARFDFDSTDIGRIQGDGPRELVDALLADVAAAPATCSDSLTSRAPAHGDGELELTNADDPQAGGGMWAGGAMWWARAICPSQRDRYILANVVALFALSQFDLSIGEGIAKCELLPVPAQAQACSEAAAGAQTTIAIVAIPSVQNAAQFAALAYVLADQIKNMAAAVGLGGPAGPAWFPIFAGANALTAVSVGQAALGAASRADAATFAAIQTMLPFAQLEPQVLTGLEMVLPRVQRHHEELHFLVLCLSNIARWIAVAGVIGLVALVVLALANEEQESIDALASRTSPVQYDPHVGPPALAGRRPTLLDGDEVVLEGPLLPRANQYAAAYPLAFDISALVPSYVQAATLAEAQGRTRREIQFGYVDPELVLTEDVWGIEALTGLPMLLAPAGTPIVLDGTYLAADAVPELVVENGAVHAKGAWLDLAAEETDAAGAPIAPPWVCVGTEHTCPLGVDTTGSPEQIAAHEVMTRYWKVMATSSIVDLESGEAFEDYAGYRVSIAAPRERPSDPCFSEFDYDEWRWIWDQTLPGCGPQGVDAGGGGEPGGGPPGGPPTLP